MFGLETITRHAHEWNRERKHRALQGMILKLPVHIQKDIGWPAAKTGRTTAASAAKVRARPIL